MKLKRFIRALAAWWWIAIIVGLLGVGAGAYAVQQRNSSITRSYSAQAYFPIEAVVTGQRGEVSAGPLQDAVRRANEVNSDLLVDGEVVITANQDQYALVFSARGADAEAATALVEKMRINFVTAEYGAVSIEDRLDLIVDEAIEVSTAAQALQPTTVTTIIPTLDPAAQARLDFLIIQVDALRGESSRLVGDLVLAETGETRNGTVAEIEAQVASVGEKLAAIYLELETTAGFEPSMLEETGNPQAPQSPRGNSTEGETAAAPGQGRSQEGAASRPSEVSIPDNESEIGPDWQRAALESRYAELQTEFQTLFEQSLDGEADGLPDATSIDATPEAFPVVFGAIGGFGLGLLLGALVILLVGKLLKPIWAASDLSPVVFFTEVPAGSSKLRSRSGRKRLDKRSRAVRAFRSTVNGILEEEAAPMSIGLVGVGARAGDTRQLAVELGNSLQAVDRAVLVIDVGFQSSGRNNVATTDTTVAGLLELVQANSEYADSQLKQTLAELTSGESGVKVLPAGILNDDAADTLLSRAFSQLLAEALSYVDVVLIPILDASQSAADSLFQRLDAVVAVCQSGSGRRRELATLIWRLEQRSAELLGGVLLVGKRGRRSERSIRERRPRQPSNRLPWLSGRQDLSKGSETTRQSPSERGLIKDAIPVTTKALVHLRNGSRQAKARVRGRVPSQRWRSLPAVTSEESAEVGLTEQLPVEKTWAMSTHQYKSRIAMARVRVRVPTSRWRALPDFLVIGAQRSGTSSLYKYLGQHPSVVPSIRKETEYFTSRHYQGQDWYRAHFPIKRDTIGPLDVGQRLTFEADPSYLLDPRAPLRASLMVPDAKIVVLLRDPVARAVSQYNHNVRLGQEQASLAEALDREDARLKGEVDRMMKDPEYPARPYLRYSYTTRGMYAEQLERWLEFYPAERVRVVHSADLFSDTAGVYQWLTDFLEIPRWQPATFANFSHTGNGNGRHVDPDVEERLRELFAPYNARLYDLIDQDFGW